VLGHGIALAFVPPEVGEGAAVEVDVRGTRLAGAVVATPFVSR
jgi:aminomethyltransferase